ncbi:hypothetical protein [Bythopirellula goksoeyrii]|uniref:Uncharacterized protein n=1 Tax=Bythopirellula goksoeyrii TaxID=1400387 RepID=A0A5B9QCG7_9BACT|nr:hypothetical protein [Bythopirellula goksoeyrii]QEG35162.1 hypothetical protein Pr1d_24530 [Bythopirellula goksoeyrii]
MAADSESIKRLERLMSSLEGCVQYAISTAEKLDPDWENFKRPECISFSYKSAYNGRIGLEKLNHDTIALVHSLLREAREALELCQKLNKNPCLADALEVAHLAYLVGISDGFLRSLITDSLIDGVIIAEKRSTGGKNSKKLVTPKEEGWLREEFAFYVGKKAACKNISKALFNKHRIKVCAKTVRKRLRELGLWENA